MTEKQAELILSGEPLEPIMTEMFRDEVQRLMNNDNVRILLEWRDAALRTCPHLGMCSEEFGAYIMLCRMVGKVPVVGGKPRPELLESN